MTRNTGIRLLMTFVVVVGCSPQSETPQPADVPMERADADAQRDIVGDDVSDILDVTDVPPDIARDVPPDIAPDVPPDIPPTGLSEAGTCPSGQTHCEASGCRDLSTDAANCGACGHACVLPHASATCTASTCAIASCTTGFSDCDATPDNGCEREGPCPAVFRPTSPSCAIQTYTAPATGTYRITAIGGRAGCSVDGAGTRMRGDFGLTGGAVLLILVGRQGTPAIGCSGGYNGWASTGGGGTFVVQGASPLIVAGGGGDYSPAVVGNDGASGVDGPGGVAGADARGWGFSSRTFTATSVCDDTGSPGYGTGGCCGLSPYAYEACTRMYCRGAGGGYSGGGDGGGGGGSYNSGVNQENAAGVGTGDGSVSIVMLSATLCSTGGTVCAERCADTSNETANCGGCRRVCALANAVATCAAGACAVARCDAGYFDCDGAPANGCETRCALPNATARCAAGACEVATCAEHFGNCDGNPANGCETDLRVDAAHCGSCAGACALAHAAATCVDAQCQIATCDAGFVDCDHAPSNGCERAGECATLTFVPTLPACVIQSYTIPATGTYRIAAAGGGPSGFAGGGAVMAGTFRLVRGAVLSLLVGQRIHSSWGGLSSSGGGGSFVVQDTTPLVIAGGSGGYGNVPYSSQGGQITEGAARGADAVSDSITISRGGPGGTAGGPGSLGGGAAGASGGEGGLGFVGRSFVPGAACTAFGGEGGRADSGGAFVALGGGGGGGGYSGGGGGGGDPGGHAPGPHAGMGGGGGSYNSGLNSENREGANTGDGWITITLLTIE